MMQNPRNLSIAFLYDDTLDSTDGVAQYVKRLGEWLGSQGHEVDYIVGQSRQMNYKGRSVISAARNIKVSWGGNRLSIPLWPEKKLIRKTLANRKYDVVHVQVPYSPLMSQYVINRLPDNVTLIGTFHIFPANWVVTGSTKLLKPVYGRSLKRFDSMLSVSQAAKDFAKKSIGVQSQILPNPVDISAFSKTKVASKAQNEIVFLGRLVKRKGCAELIMAAGYLKNNLGFKHFNLTIAGDGPERERLKSLVNKLGLEEQVRFLGFIPEEDKPALLAGAAIACFPSLYGESFGIVLIEAMAAGSRVVLGGDNPGYRSVLGAHKELLINPRNTAGFAERLQELLQNNQLAGKLHTWQRNEVKRYDLDTVGSRLVDIYYDAVATKSTRRHN